MIAAEITTSHCVVRIHDDNIAYEPKRYMNQVGQIVSDHYKRRMRDIPPQFIAEKKPR